MKASILALASLLSSANGFTAGPTVSRKNTALKDVTALDPEIMAAVAAAVAIAAATTATMGKGEGSSAKSSSSTGTAEPEPEIIDVSIPYNAAARLAFAETKLSNSRFQEFETLYLAKTVAGVTAKKMARDVVEMEKVAAKLAQEMESLS
jgi:hypothetical protein